MSGNRVRFRLAFCILLALIAMCVDSAQAANEILNVVPNPTTPRRANVTTITGTTTMSFAVTLSETSGQPDTVQMSYSCTDQYNNSLPCSPSSDYLSISKGHPVNDACAVDCSRKQRALRSPSPLAQLGRMAPATRIPNRRKRRGSPEASHRTRAHIPHHIPHHILHHIPQPTSRYRSHAFALPPNRGGAALLAPSVTFNPLSGLHRSG